MPARRRSRTKLANCAIALARVAAGSGVQSTSGTSVSIGTILADVRKRAGRQDAGFASRVYREESKRTGSKVVKQCERPSR